MIAGKRVRISAGAGSVRTGSWGLALIKPCACAMTRSMIVHYTTKFLRKPGLSGGSYQILIDQEACLPGQPTVALACSWRTREVRIPAPPGCAGVLPACSDAIHDGGAGITLSTAPHGAGCPRSVTTAGRGNEQWMTAITIMLVSRRLKWISVCERSNPTSSVVGVTPLVRAKEALPERVEAPVGLARLCRGARWRRAHLR